MARSEVNYNYDALTAFVTPEASAFTASAPIAGTEQALGKLENVRPSSQRGHLSAEEYRVVIVVESIAVGDDQEYTFTFVVGNDSVETGIAATDIYATGQHVFIFDAATIEKLAGSHIENIWINLAVTGTDPEIKFSAWLI